MVNLTHEYVLQCIDKPIQIALVLLENGVGSKKLTYNPYSYEAEILVDKIGDGDWTTLSAWKISPSSQIWEDLIKVFNNI